MKLFIPQVLLDRWVSDGEAVVDGQILRRGTTAPEEYRLQSGVHFLRVDGDMADSSELVGRVKDEAQLRALGAEVVSNSAIIGDTAYVVIPGFVARGAANVGAGADTSSRSKVPGERGDVDAGIADGVEPPPTATQSATAVTPEEDLLTRFLLEKI